MIKKVKLDHRFSVAVSMEHLIKMAQNGINSKIIRQWIEAYSHNENRITIKSSEWRRLKDILDKVPSLVLIGVPNAGKTYLVRELVSRDKENVYIILSSHPGFEMLPKIHEITPHITQSSVLEMNKMDAAAGITFEMYKSLIQYHSFPKNFVLVIDDSLRYENHGIDLMLSESRKFLKILAVAQRRLKNVDFITELYLENYNPVRI